MTPCELPAASPSRGIDRRALLKGGVLGAGLLAGPLAAGGLAEKGFTHGVASGEPGARRVMLWTRHVGTGATRLTFEVSDSLDFARVLAQGEAVAAPERDFCAKAWADGLKPGLWYYYRFIAPDGSRSDIGRTRTLPEGPTARWRMAVFSCSNIGFGWFNAYAHAAAADEFDCALHLGDYLYEYSPAVYPGAAQTLPGRPPLEPANELILLADYRARYAHYRRDADLRRLHQVYPMIVVADDHESANDAWSGGAQGHDPASEGPWDARKSAAVQAWREWMPVSDEPWAKYQVGDLATLFRLETRLTGRSQQLSYTALLNGLAPEAVGPALAALRDGAWRDPAREMLGTAQQGWLAAGLGQSKRAGTRWQVLVQQVLMGSLATPEDLIGALPADAPDFVRRRFATGTAAAAAGLPFNLDSWDGYPAARERVLRAALEAGADLVSLAGDTHNAWAFDLDLGGERVGVEFGGQSVASPGFESAMRGIPEPRLSGALIARNPQLKWANMDRRGYMAVELTPERASSEYRMLADPLTRGTALAGSHRVTSFAGRRRIETA